MGDCGCRWNKATDIVKFRMFLVATVPVKCLLKNIILISETLLCKQINYFTLLSFRNAYGYD